MVALVDLGVEAEAVEVVDRDCLGMERPEPAPPVDFQEEREGMELEPAQEEVVEGQLLAVPSLSMEVGR